MMIEGRYGHAEMKLLLFGAPSFFLLLWALTQLLSRTVDFEAAPNLLSFPRSVLLGITIGAVLGTLFLMVGLALAGKNRLLFDNHLLLFMGFASLGAMGFEILVDSAWSHLFGQPIWTYHVLPLHGGHTSVLGLIGWPLYGFYIYMLHENLARNPKIRRFDTPLCKSVLIGMDAMAVEIGLNLLSILAFGSYIFYYHSGEFFHFTALVIFPIYVVIGSFLLWVLGKFKAFNKSVFYGGACYLSAIVLAILGLN